MVLNATGGSKIYGNITVPENIDGTSMKYYFGNLDKKNFYSS